MSPCAAQPGDEPDGWIDVDGRVLGIVSRARTRGLGLLVRVVAAVT